MRISQLIHKMDKDDEILINEIIINDKGKPINVMELYAGSARGIKRDDPINKMHVNRVFACEGIMVVLVGERSNR